MNKNAFLIKKDLYYFLPIGILLILIAGFRPIGIDHDSLNYVDILNTSLSNANFLDKEPAFWIINELNKLIFDGNVQTFFLIFAILGVTLKLIAIKKYSLLPLMSVFTYVSLYFVLHEMTQIRVGVASGIFLLALEDIKNRDLKGYVFKTIIAMSFHYSAVIMVLVYFIKHDKINLKLFFILPIIGVFLVIFKNISLNILSNMLTILPELIGYKLKTYILLLEYEKFSNINIFNTYYLSLFLIYYFALLNYKRMKSEYDIIFIKILGLTIFLFYFLSFLPVMAFRVSEFFGVILIFLIPHILLTIKQKIIASIPVIIWLVMYFIFIMIFKNLNI